MSRYSATRLLYGATAHHDTAQGTPTGTTVSAESARQGLCVAIQFLYRGQGGCDTVDLDAATQRASARVRAATWLRHGRAWPATRHPVRHDTAPSALCGRPGRNALAMCAQAGSGCAHCTPDSVLTQCTVLS